MLSLVLASMVVGRSTVVRPMTTVRPDPYARWLRSDSDVPRVYRGLIVQAGRSCEVSGMSPALIAAMLKVESGFDPRLRDPGRDEYGIARWTPAVLAYWQPGGVSEPAPRPEQITPVLSIPALGRYLCSFGKDLKNVPGDPAVNLAVAYRTSPRSVVESKGVPPQQRAYSGRVAYYIRQYRPRS
ncbi:hypothetical protein [Actinomadura sp. NTSP31]|uniref:hypothetical protein n=1 Tax=Actinomadura sp. NTSP31 TaxID=1735447 RepID=UPI0035BF582B